MTFTTQPATASFEHFQFPEMVEIPEGEWTQGSDKSSYQDNPRRRVHLDRFEVGTKLVTVRDYKRFVTEAQSRGRFGYFGRVQDGAVRHNVKAGDEILYGYAKDRMETGGVRDGFAPYQNLSFMEMGAFHIEEIAPESGWLEAAVQKHKLDPIFLADDTPITFQSQWDAHAYVAFLNHELARLRTAVASRQIDEATLTQADRLLLTGGWYDLPTAAQIQRVMAGPQGDFEFGTRDGRPESMTDRPFAHIGLALEQAHEDGGVPWERYVEELFGVLFHRTRDHYDDNSNRPDPRGALIHNPRGARQGIPELSGGASWNLNDERFFAAAFRGYDYVPGYRNDRIGLRVVRPRP
jgi:formylglycine-generating enzyme required for sulfatase activity